jgi:hypothetical protein
MPLAARLDIVVHARDVVTRAHDDTASPGCIEKPPPFLTQQAHGFSHVVIAFAHFDKPPSTEGSVRILNAKG